MVHTAQLRQRPPRKRDYEAEIRALASFALTLANPPGDILQHLAESALDLCAGGSAGISIIENHLGEKVFRWHALTGALAAHRWGTTPRDFSPCGTVIDRNAVQLMLLPERHFLYFANVKPQIVEGLLVPFAVHGQTVGTVWVVTHDDRRRFDAEDARLIEELAQLASRAYQLAASVAASKISDRRKDQFLAALAHELRSPLSTAGSTFQDARDLASSTTSPQQSARVLGEHQLRSMKRVITDLLDHSKAGFETIAAASRSGIAGPEDAVSLLRRMRWGDQNALEELYDHTAASVYALARAILRNAEDAEEVVCDTYAQAWRQCERFDVERASPIGWLMMMCRSRAIDRLRQNRSRGVARLVALESAHGLANDAPTPEELFSLFHHGSRLRDALAALSPQRLTLVGLAFCEGLSSQEIAEHTGMPLGTVKSHIRRALAELRRTLQPH